MDKAEDTVVQRRRNPIRVGLVGASANPWAWASRAHVPALRALPDYEVVAIASRTQENADAAARAHGIPRAYGRYPEMLLAPDIDLVCVSTSAAHHRALVLPAIAAGKHVFCEWPFGTDLAEAVEMQDAADRRGVHTAVGLQNRFAPAIAFVRDLLAEGYLGTLYSATLSRSNDQTARTAVTREYLEFLETADAGLRILAGHALDVLAACIGELVDLQSYVETEMSEIAVVHSDVPARITTSDHILVQGRLASGAVVSATIRKNSPTHRPFHLELGGSRGALVITSTPEADATDRQPGVPHELTVYGTPELGRPFEQLHIPPRYRTATNAPDDQAGPVAMLYQRFATSIRNDSPFEADFAHGVTRHRLLETVRSAAVTGARATFHP